MLLPQTDELDRLGDEIAALSAKVDAPFACASPGRWAGCLASLKRSHAGSCPMPRCVR
jgi:hypothetical protein